MPWFYAGTDAKPVGPISLEELHARHHAGTVSPDTYVIEYVGQPGDHREWKRYRDLFSTQPALSPSPLPPPAPPAPHLPPPFPQPPAAHVSTPPRFSPTTFAHAAPPPQILPHKRTNPWCSWGFGIGLASLILLIFTCGLSSLLALPGLVISGIGLYKVQHDTTQSGNRLAISGLLLSLVTIVITAIIFSVALPIILKSHGLITTTEQSTTDSE